MNDKQRALEPCPFCGREATFRILADGYVPKYYDVYVECKSKKCRASMGKVHCHEDDISGEKVGLVNLWNTRVSQPATPEGWKLVPESLTKEMMDAMFGHMTAIPLESEMDDLWNAVIAAAPVQEEKE